MNLFEDKHIPDNIPPKKKLVLELFREFGRVVERLGLEAGDKYPLEIDGKDVIEAIAEATHHFNEAVQKGTHFTKGTYQKDVLDAVEKLIKHHKGNTNSKSPYNQT